MGSNRRGWETTHGYAGWAPTILWPPAFTCIHMHTPTPTPTICEGREGKGEMHAKGVSSWGWDTFTPARVRWDYLNCLYNSRADEMG